MIRSSYLLLASLLFMTCEVTVKSTDQSEEKPAPGPREGEWISRREDGTIKTKINYEDGIKHGMSYLYYDDGKTLQLEMPYVVGARHGIAKKYFKDGAVYAETSYASDVLHGIRKTFYRNGNLKSEIEYHGGFPSTNLQEFYLDGSPKPSHTIDYIRNGSQLTLRVEPEKDCKRPRFFFGNLVDGNYFNEKADMEEIFPEQGNFTIDLNVYTPSFLRMQDIICKCESSQGNPVVVRTRIQL